MPQPQQPPQQPPVIVNPSPVQEVPIYIPVPSGNPGSNEVNVDTPANSSAVSEAENISSNAASLNAYQVNSNHEASYYKYSNNVVMPGTSVYADLSVINNEWDWGRTNTVASIGVRHTFGGVQKKLAVESVRKDNLAKSLSVCNSLGVFEGKVDIDYKMMPDLAPCEYISQRVVVEKTTSNEITILKQQMLEYQKLIKEQQNTIQAFQMRLIQMEHGTPVRVGG